MEVQGNYNLILERVWVHANQCVPSTLHQFLFQWIGDEVEVVHGDTSSFVALADSDSISAHDNVKCLSSVDLSDYDLISTTEAPEATGQTACADWSDRSSPVRRTGPTS